MLFESEKKDLHSALTFFLAHRISTVKRQRKVQGQEESIAITEEIIKETLRYCWNVLAQKQIKSEGGCDTRYSTETNRVKHRCKEQQLTQEQLAEKAGISRVHLSNIESGIAQPSITVAGKIATALDSTISALFEEGGQDADAG